MHLLPINIFELFLQDVHEPVNCEHVLHYASQDWHFPWLKVYPGAQDMQAAGSIGVVHLIQA